MFDVFYIGSNAPGLFVHERAANSVQHAQSLARTRYLWIVDGANDYSGFDWHWEPVPWQADQAHVWPSQHQDNGGTWLIPKNAYRDVNRDHAVVLRKGSAPRLHVKHISNSEDQGDINTRFISDYLGTLRRILSKVTWEYCWVTADVCDYHRFDFTWHPSEWQQTMLHVFASDDQLFGDTFYVHVPTFLARSQDLVLLEWYDTLHFVEKPLTVPRRPVPVVQHHSDSHVDAVWQHDFEWPMTQFGINGTLNRVPAMNLWRAETRAIMPLTQGATRVLVPRDAKTALRTQLYDYPVIDRACAGWGTDQPLDIVFISNGEHGAEHHWNILQGALTNHMAPNRLHRVDGVNGRVAAYQAAAKKSATPWFFAVFAKLQVNQDFDWSWQPDRMQEAKHYIFHAYNPVNHLVYGHQAMIAYNAKLVMANQGHGLDFTLDNAHEVVPMVSGTAYYDNDPWTCWRTAFRESIKLRHSLPDVENDYRLQQWLLVGEGINGHWSTTGANDAVRYYESVDGDFAEIKKSYEWAWLAAYAMMIHPELVTQSRT
jgi:hypothetical protein